MKHKVTQEEIILLMNLYKNQNFTLMDISKKVQIPVSTIRRYLKKAGCKFRKPVHTRILRGDDISAHLRGRPKIVSKETGAKISKAKLGKGKGTRINSQGYLDYTMGEHKFRSVHVVEMEKLLGRKIIYKKECVHHIDGNKLNNNLDNLAFMTTAAHSRLHRLQESMQGKTRKTNNKGRFI